MKVYKTVERVCASPEGLKKAVSEGVREVNSKEGTVEKVTVQNIEAIVQDGEVVDWHVTMKFLISA